MRERELEVFRNKLLDVWALDEVCGFKLDDFEDLVAVLVSLDLVPLYGVLVIRGST